MEDDIDTDVDWGIGEDTIDLEFSDFEQPVSTVLAEDDVTLAVRDFDSTTLLPLATQLAKLVGLQSDVNPTVAELGREILASLQELLLAMRGDIVGFIMENSVHLDLAAQRELVKHLQLAAELRSNTIAKLMDDAGGQ